MNAQELMLAAAVALERCRIPSMLVGAFSASYHGIGRSTEDADFVVQVAELPVRLLAEKLGPDFYIDPQTRLETFTMGEYYVIKRVDSDFVVELFLLKEDPHSQESFRRRVRVPYGGGEVFLSTAEDLIVTKLRWSQGGRRHKDIDDARNVLAVKQGKLDMAYIRSWCEQHGTAGVLDEVLKSVPNLPPG
jgi:hypothetical protein